MASSSSTLKELIHTNLTQLRNDAFSAHFHSHGSQPGSLSWDVEIRMSENSTSFPSLVSNKNKLPSTEGWSKADLETLARALIAGRVHVRVTGGSEEDGVLDHVQSNRVSQAPETDPSLGAAIELRKRLIDTIEREIGRPLVYRTSARLLPFFPCTSDYLAPNFYRWQFSDQYPRFPPGLPISSWGYLDTELCHQALDRKFLTVISIDPESQEAAFAEISTDTEGSVFDGDMAEIGATAPESSSSITNYVPEEESGMQTPSKVDASWVNDPSHPLNEAKAFQPAPFFKQEIDGINLSGLNSGDMMRDFAALQTRMLEAVVGKKCQELRASLKETHDSEMRKLKRELGLTQNKWQAEKSERKRLAKELNVKNAELRAEDQRFQRKAMELSKAENQLEMMSTWNQETVDRVSQLEMEVKAQQEKHTAELEELKNSMRFDDPNTLAGTVTVIGLQRQIRILQARLNFTEAALNEQLRIPRFQEEKASEVKAVKNSPPLHRAVIKSFGLGSSAPKKTDLSDSSPPISGNHSLRDGHAGSEPISSAPIVDPDEVDESGDSEETMLASRFASPQAPSEQNTSLIEAPATSLELTVMPKTISAAIEPRQKELRARISASRDPLPADTDRAYSLEPRSGSKGPVSPAPTQNLIESAHQKSTPNPSSNIRARLAELFGPSLQLSPILPCSLQACFTSAFIGTNVGPLAAHHLVSDAVRSKIVHWPEMLTIIPEEHELSPRHGSQRALTLVEGKEKNGEIGKTYPVLIKDPSEALFYIGHYKMSNKVIVSVEVWKSWPIDRRRSICREIAENAWGQTLLAERGLQERDQTTLPNNAEKIDEILSYFERSDDEPNLRMNYTLLEFSGYRSEDIKILWNLSRGIATAAHLAQVPLPVFEATLSFWLSEKAPSGNILTNPYVSSWYQRLQMRFRAKTSTTTTIGMLPTDTIRILAQSAGMVGRDFTDPDNLWELKRIVAGIALKLLAMWKVGKVQEAPKLLGLFKAIHTHLRVHLYGEKPPILPPASILPKSFSERRSPSASFQVVETRIIPQKRTFDSALSISTPKRAKCLGAKQSTPAVTPAATPTSQGPKIVVEVYSTPKIDISIVEVQDPEWEVDAWRNDTWLDGAWEEVERKADLEVDDVGEVILKEEDAEKDLYDASPMPSPKPDGSIPL